MRRPRPPRLVCLPALLVGLFPVSTALHASGEEPQSPHGDVMSLEDRLVTGLRARRPEDVAFLERVATLVEEGRLPEKVVNSTLAWAQRRGRNYPLPSFRRALELQADHLGVSLRE